MITENRPSFIQRKVYCSLKKQATDPQNVEEITESHPKEYRLLAYCFYNNINKYYSKRHKDLLGELEDSYKIPLAKEERILVEENLEAILDKNILKLVRDTLMRNSSISKNINDYLESYNKICKSPCIQLSNFLQVESIQPNPKDKRNESNCRELIKQRICSSNREREKRSTQTCSYEQRIKSRNGTISLGKEDNEFGTINNEEAECYVYVRQNCRRVSKTKQNSKNTKYKDKVGFLEENNPINITGETEFMKNKSEVIGVLHEYEKCVEHLGGKRTKVWGKQKEKEFEDNLGLDLKEVNSRINWNKYFNIHITNTLKLQSVNDIEKIKVQNKIMSIKNHFSQPMPKSQGYRPKSKCWGTPVNSIGKSNMKDRTDFGEGFGEGGCNNEKHNRFASTFLRLQS